MPLISFLPVMVALAVTVACVPFSMFLARQFGLLDVPDARKVHRSPTPRLAGIAILAGVIAACLSALGILRWTGYPIDWQQVQQFLAIGGAALFVFLVGLVDDIRSVSSGFKPAT